MLLASIGTLLLAGCSTPWVEESGEDWRTLVATLPSNGSGNIRALVRPEEGETNLLISFQTLGNDRFSHLRFLEVGGEVPYRATTETENVRSRSSAAYVSSVTNFNWPIARSDGSLSAERHELTAGIVDGSFQYLKGEARVGVMLKSDPDLSSGLLRVNVVFGGGASADEDISRAVDEAIQVWRDIYAEVGIQLDLQLFDTPEAVLQAPGQGDAGAYEEIARATRFGAVNLVILEDIAGFAGALGFAGNIPGPLISSGQSAVAVNTTLGAGTDGRFSPEEIGLLGETMAHEVGHFLGLYHPVEVDLEGWDALEDTPECEERVACEDVLGDNLMYPIPLCDENGCLPQRALSDEQGEVANRYTGVL